MARDVADSAAELGALPDAPAARTCFVAAPPGADIRAIEAIVERNGYRSLAVTDFPLYGLSATNAIAAAISQADIVLGLIAEDQQNANVIFELGMASALGKPVIALVESAAFSAPADFADVVMVYAPGGHFGALEFALQQLPEPGKPTPPAELAERPIPAHDRGMLPRQVADALLRELQELSPRATETMLIEILLEALQASGLIVVPGGEQGQRFDIGVWSNQSGWIVGNPLLIEVKRSIRSAEGLERLLARMSSYVAATNAQWALLVYHRGPDPERYEELARPYPILLARLDLLIQELAKTGLPAFLRSARNRRVHG
jgi:hypothetical protein